MVEPLDPREPFLAEEHTAELLQLCAEETDCNLDYARSAYYRRTGQHLHKLACGCCTAGCICSWHGKDRAKKCQYHD